MDFKKLLFPSYSPDNNVIRLPTTKRQQRVQQAYNYNGLSITPKSGVLLRHSEEVVGDNTIVHVTDVVGPATDNGLRQQAVTIHDIEQLKKRKLDEHKAAVLKPFWAAGMTASQACVMVRNLPGGSRGLGKRRVEDYYAAFREALALLSGEG